MYSPSHTQKSFGGGLALRSDVELNSQSFSSNSLRLERCPELSEVKFGRNREEDFFRRPCPPPNPVKAPAVPATMIHAHMCTLKQLRKPHARTGIQAHTGTHTCTSWHACLNAQPQARVHMQGHVHMHACTTLRQTHISTHTHTHTYAHTKTSSSHKFARARILTHIYNHAQALD